MDEPRFRRRVRRLAPFVVIALSITARTAQADPTPEEKARATALFHEARALIERGDVTRLAEACEKLAESQRLDPGGGTLLNLATCHEKQRKLASAWAEFTEALAIARRDGRRDREDFATEHIAAIQPRLSRLRIDPALASEASGLEIRLDGSVVGAATWGSAVPIDSGVHTLDARAPNRKAWSERFTIEEHETKVLAVPPLEAEPQSPAPPAESLIAPRAALTLVPDYAPPPRSSTKRYAGYVMTGLGVAVVGAGSYFGVRAFQKRADSDALCGGGRCSGAGAVLNDDAKHAADTSTVLLTTGLAVLAAGVYLWISGAAY